MVRYDVFIIIQIILCGVYIYFENCYAKYIIRNNQGFNYQDNLRYSSYKDRYISISGTPSFGEVSDYQFGIHENAAILKKEVQYCQGRGLWSSISYNYPYSQDVHDNIVSAPVFLRNYQISSDFFSPSKARTILVPNYTQLSTFVHSDGQRDFRYIGNGYFYSEIHPGYSPILKTDLGFDTNGKLSDYRRKQLMNTCNAGDRFVIFTVYQPRDLTIEGEVRGSSIYPTYFFHFLNSNILNRLSYIKINETDRFFLSIILITIIIYCFVKTINKLLSFSILGISAAIGAYFIPTFLISWDIAIYLLLAGITTLIISMK